MEYQVWFILFSILFKKVSIHHNYIFSVEESQKACVKTFLIVFCHVEDRMPTGGSLR